MVRKMIPMMAAALMVLACLAGCSQSRTTAVHKTDADEALVVYCPHPLEFINPIVSEFESRTGIRVKVCTGGTGELLAMVEEGREPACDIFWGGSLSTTVARKALFEPYISSNEDMVQEEFKNAEGNMTRFTDIPSVLMVNRNLIGNVQVKGYEDLLQPELKGKIAMCDPAVSSSAYEHLINMLYAMGGENPEDGWQYVSLFCENLDGRLLGGSSEVYKGVAEGRYAVGLTFEEGASHYVAEGSPVNIVYMEEGVISKPDVVCIVKGSRHMEEASAFVDFVTGKDAQTMISLNLDRRSVRMDVPEPEYLPDKSKLPMIYDDGLTVNENKDRWLLQFTQLFENACGK